MTERVELFKVVCVGVCIVRDGDRIVREIESPPRYCYSPEDLAALWEAALEEVVQVNAQAEAMATNGDRQAHQEKEEGREREPAGDTE